MTFALREMQLFADNSFFQLEFASQNINKKPLTTCLS